ncbi:homeobox-leucine zipper protein ATHB-54-like [Lycium ferocissimum]|uniref:homeobox-leucine zipper protein ATHB-54-like n=1 Tax=Lycium ferocissimum TaxID=112874 RepID=UPI002815D3C4|nr:homeobox-leucine zipper protein ATHB-54-like [Lycium ferocissimum]
MEVARVYESSNMTTNNGFLLPNESLSPPSKVLDSLWVSNNSPIFHGSASMVNFDETRGERGKKRSFFPQLDNKENITNEDDYEVCFHQTEKKIRRLSPKQVQFLEKSFEVENKLEPERKVQLANEIGLQPRQVAIWFQNRRARYKTKQLEKDYDVLKASFDKLKDDYDCLFKENETLRNEVHLLKEKLLNKVNDEENSEQNNPISPLDVEADNPIGVTKILAMVVCKQEDASSAKSDILDSDSPRGNYTSFFEPTTDSSNVFETEALSDFSQEDDNLISKSLLPTLCFPKLEEDHLPLNSSNLGFDQSWFWHY